jgi:hypothetical protein
MIISDEHRYVFVAVPQTGSTAITKELCENYGGQPILQKHTTLNEFLAQATPEQRRYFRFAGLRHPLDDAVSTYFKFKTNHYGVYTNPDVFVENGGWVTSEQRSQFHFINDAHVDFPAYFERFHCGRVFSGRQGHELREVDFVIRFEQLVHDFAEAIRLLGLPVVRPLPVYNETSDRDRSFLDYYPHELLVRAQDIYGPFLLRHGYDLPAPGHRPSLLSRAEFQALELVSASRVRKQIRRAFSGARRLTRGSR